VSRFERGITVPTEKDVAALLDVYGASPNVKRRMLGLAQDVRATRRPLVMVRPQARRGPNVKPSLFQARLGRIEAASEHVGTFSNTVVPGLLQTAEYAREMFLPRQLGEEETAAFVARRIARQELLDDETHRFTLIFAEGVLGWRAGTDANMATQVEKIAEATRRPNVRVGVIPWGARPNRFPMHAFELYDGRAVSYGTIDATAILTEPGDVSRYAELFSELAAVPVFYDEAREILARVADPYRSLC